mgnify:CR=1 FL=1
MTRARRSIAISVSAAAISALVLGGTALAQNLGVSDYAPESYIGFDAAAQAAVSNVGGVATKVELERENGVMLYEVTCVTETGEKEVDINAVTGETTAVRNEDGRNSNNQPSQGASGRTDQSGNSSQNANGSYIGEDAALQAALDSAGVDRADITSEKVKFDRDDGRALYEVDFKTDDVKYEYEIDASTGAVISSEQERRGNWFTRLFD